MGAEPGPRAGRQHCLRSGNQWHRDAARQRPRRRLLLLSVLLGADRHGRGHPRRRLPSFHPHVIRRHGTGRNSESRDGTRARHRYGADEHADFRHRLRAGWAGRRVAGAGCWSRAELRPGVHRTSVHDRHRRRSRCDHRHLGSRRVALSLDFVWGRAGIFSFGQTAFFGVAAYAYGVIGINLSPNTGETVTALVGAVVAAAALAAALGYFMFYGKVGDVYVAIITLAVTLVLLQVMTSTAGPQYHIGKAQLGGYNGMTNIPSMEFGYPGHPGDQMSQPDTYNFVVLLAGVAFFFVRVLLRSGFGRVITAIRENELRTELLGYDVRRAKVIVFTVGGAVAGLAGGAYAGWGNFMNPAPFSLPAAALIVIYVLVGGKGTLVGAFIGTVAVEWLSTALRGILPSSTTLVVGAILIGVVLLVPGGLTPLIGHLVSRIVPSPPRALRKAGVGGAVGGASRGQGLQTQGLV